jgi:ABC-type dipeptide/oligopeptide/nickel transport system ATPase subunit/GNAT superfamily N-acetyltransferase
MFDVPPSEKVSLSWRLNIPLNERAWNVGLIVGPSGAGKSTIAKELFGESYEPKLEWHGKSVVDDIRQSISVQDITSAFSSVGFNTIPAWLRPYSVLSTGEKFRVEMARRLLELPDPIVVDEFTSVVDRQVAKIGANAIQKIVRKNNRQFVAVGCHYDVIDWLQPDWVIDPSTMTFTWRSLRRRPIINVEIRRVDHSLWRKFAPFHYMSADLHKAAACFAAFVEDRPVAFAGVLHFPHAKVRDVKRISRLVTLPDWQGIGLSFVLVDALGSAYSACGYRLRMYPAHPSLIRSYDRSAKWSLRKKPGSFSSLSAGDERMASLGGRPCAVFEYVGEKIINKDAALAFILGK